jgi:hypothetical protein
LVGYGKFFVPYPCDAYAVQESVADGHQVAGRDGVVGGPFSDFTSADQRYVQFVEHAHRGDRVIEVCKMSIDEEDFGAVDA